MVSDDAEIAVQIVFEEGGGSGQIRERIGKKYKKGSFNKDAEGVDKVSRKQLKRAATSVVITDQTTDKTEWRI